MIFILF